MESWEPHQHLLLHTGKPRKTCVEVTGRRTFRSLTSSQQSGFFLTLCKRFGRTQPSHQGTSINNFKFIRVLGTSDHGKFFLAQRTSPGKSDDKKQLFATVLKEQIVRRRRCHMAKTERAILGRAYGHTCIISLYSYSQSYVGDFQLRVLQTTGCNESFFYFDFVTYLRRNTINLVDEFLLKDDMKLRETTSGSQESTPTLLNP